ncbi:sigma-54-dependent Fis family transcriptional regulator [bacterium]|nr:sigma-54-dependent Fis family transcriptional regulator [bacterium]
MSNTCALQILIADDESNIRTILSEYLARKEHHIFTACDGLEALAQVEQHVIDLAMIDIRMPHINGIELHQRIKTLSPRTEVVIITGYGNMDLAISAFRKGVLDFLKKPISLADIDAILEMMNCPDRSYSSVEQSYTEVGPGFNADGPSGPQLIGPSQALETIRKQIAIVAQSNCDTVLIRGETGVGKDVIAREIHRLRDPSRPFVAVSCPALPDTLIESEFFGHTKGAYTGATADRRGYFELAHKGILYLDEIGDLSWSGQAKLLRVIETRSFRRVGHSNEYSIDTLIVAATNKILEEQIKAGTFRADLYYRLNVHTFYVPPLRERVEDIMPLAKHFLALFNQKYDKGIKGFDQDSIILLEQYQYPGNVRELRNMIERVVFTCTKDKIICKNFKEIVYNEQALLPDEPRITVSERDYLLSLLKQHHWNRNKVAHILSIPYSTLRYKIAKYKISR